MALTYDYDEIMRSVFGQDWQEGTGNGAESHADGPKASTGTPSNPSGPSAPELADRYLRGEL